MPFIEHIYISMMIFAHRNYLHNSFIPYEGLMYIIKLYLVYSMNASTCI
jgi:hypothetical protein